MDELCILNCWKQLFIISKYDIGSKDLFLLGPDHLF